jgi:hypothetical protein
VTAPARQAVAEPPTETLLTNLSAANACTKLAGSFLGIVDGKHDGPEHASAERVGRWWIQDCQIKQDGDHLDVHLAGPAWQWVAEKKKQLGAKFNVAQYIPLDVTLDMRGQLDLAYVEDRDVISIWFTPVKPVKAKVVPTSQPDVDAKGLWSRVLGALVTVTTFDSPEERAADSVKQTGSRRLQERFNKGLTITVDLCSGQADQVPVALDEGVTPKRPFPLAGRIWEQNERVHLHPGGLDVSGPFGENKKMFAEVEVEKGGAVTAELVCMSQVPELVRAFLKGKRLPELAPKAKAVVLASSPATLIAEPDESCRPLALVTRPSSESSDSSVFRYVVYEEGSDARPLVPCK